MEVKGFPNYLIYEDGRVFNKKFNRYLKFGERSGYYKVCLYNSGIKKEKNIHRLVAEHYIPNLENNPQVDHIDRNKKNNHVKNLRWVTISQNQQNKDKCHNNKSGVKNITKINENKYVYNKMINNVKIQKYFKTLEEAVEYKNKNLR